MPIENIEEIPNENLPKKLNPVKEVMNKYIPNVIEGVLWFYLGFNWFRWFR